MNGYVAGIIIVIIIVGGTCINSYMRYKKDIAYYDSMKTRAIEETKRLELFVAELKGS